MVILQYLLSLFSKLFLDNLVLQAGIDAFDDDPGGRVEALPVPHVLLLVQLREVGHEIVFVLGFPEVGAIFILLGVHVFLHVVKDALGLVLLAPGSLVVRASRLCLTCVLGRGSLQVVVEGGLDDRWRLVDG